MHYPIFHSIVNTVKTQLSRRGIQSKKFRTWEDNKIHATGLEIQVDLTKSSTFLTDLSINFDWDSFRETAMASRMEGMEKHPLLKVKQLTSVKAPTNLDVEMTWLFSVEHCQPYQPGKEGNYRIDQASRWMEAISQRLNTLLKDENIITRWHIEIEGDEYGRYLSAINLISYFQYELGALKNVNDLQKYVGRKLQELLLKGSRVINLSDEILAKTIAA